MNMLASSFTGYAKPFASVNPSLLPFRASSLRHDYPLASKIVVKNLPYSTGETTLQKEFSNFGKIAEDDAMLALETMDQKDFYGRTIGVEIARLGWDDFGASPRASGPPKKWHLPEQGEVVPVKLEHLAAFLKLVRANSGCMPMFDCNYD
ncbi:hypothetical protein JHK82_012850 [Glycine max]|nr:hypothetical protein JHK85_013210 [Glycine max]KAG5057872.1 hypothetical protein JHK86_012868 [Glycine max]KAG5154881.1 hypothetical protein JHK82_012850 [Glycine max]